MQHFVSHDATGANLLAAQFELRFDEDEKAGAGFCRCYCGRNYLPDRDERNINHHDVDAFGKVFNPQFTRIPLDGNNARILPQLPVKLFHVYVDSVDARCAVLQQAIRETAVRSADIQANARRWLNRKVFQRAFEFCSTAAGELLQPAGDFDPRVFRDGHACLFHSFAVHLNFTGDNHGHGFLRRVGAASLDEKKIEAFAACLWFHEAFEQSSAAKHQEFRDIAEARGTFRVRSKLGNGLGRQIVGNLVRALQPVNRGIGCLLLRHVFSCRLAERGGGFLDVKNVVRNLESPADSLAESPQARDIFGAGACAYGTGCDRGADQRSGFRAVNVLQHLRIDGLAFGFDVSDLATDHSIDSASGSRHFDEDGDAAFGGGGGSSHGFESERKKSVTSKNGDGFAKFFMTSRFAAAEVVIVQCRQIIVNQGVGMDKFYRASGVKGGCDIAGENARRLETEDGADALSTSEDAVAHGSMNGRGPCGFGRKEPLESGIDGQPVLFEKCREFHRRREPARGKMSKQLTIRPPARGQKARRQACHRLSSGGFLLGPQPLPIASGTRGRVRRPLRTASSRRRGTIAGFPAGGRLPQGGPESAQSPASSAVRVSWEQVNSRDRPVSFIEAPISGSARSNKLTGCPAQCAGSAVRSGGRVFPRGRRREECSPIPGTTTPDRESWAPDVDSILRHARERTQLLYAGGALPAVSRCSRGGEGRGERATAIRKSRCCRCRRRALDPARSPSTGAL